MFKYKVQVKKVSGRLNESAIPSKNFVVKSKTKKTDKKVFLEVAKYCREKYGIEVESAEVIFEGFFGNVKKSFGKAGSAIKNAAKTLGSDLKNDVKSSYNNMKSKVSGMFNRGNKQQNQTSSPSQPQQSQPQPQPQPQSQQFKKQESRIGELVKKKILLVTGFYDYQVYFNENQKAPSDCLLTFYPTIENDECEINAYCYALSDIWNGGEVPYHDSKLKVLLTTNTETNRMIRLEQDPTKKNKLLEYKNKLVEEGGFVDIKEVKVKGTLSRYKGVAIMAPVHDSEGDLIGYLFMRIKIDSIREAANANIVDEGFAKIFNRYADELENSYAN